MHLKTFTTHFKLVANPLNLWLQAFTFSAEIFLDIISTAISTIKLATSTVIVVITITISFPFGISTFSSSLQAFAFSAEIFLDIVSTAISSIKLATSIVIVVITITISFPLGTSTFSRSRGWRWCYRFLFFIIIKNEKL